MPIDRIDQGASASDMGAKLAHLVNAAAIVANHLPDDAAADTFVAALDPAREAIATAETLLAALKAVEAWDRLGSHSLPVGSMAHVFAIVRAAIAKAEPLPADPKPIIYMQFSDDGQHIRKWSFEPFEAGARYIPAFVPSWDNPDGPQAA